jgi:hypothetical protein
MIKICKTVAVFMLAFALVAGPAMAQAISGAGTYTSGGSQTQFVGGSVSTGTGGTQTFSLGSGFMYSMSTVNPNEAAALQNQGIRTIVVPAGKMVYVTAQTGQPLNINTGQPGAAPNMIVFGPGGFVGTGVFAGPGAGAFAGVGPGAVAGAGAGGISVGAGPVVGSMQMYSFTGSPGQAYLITQQSGGTVDRVLVVFQ